MNDGREEPTVVVVGGGYAGVNAAKALDEHAAVVLVEPKDAFVHTVAALRALVDPAFLPRIFLPYDQLLERGRVVRDRAAREELVRAERVLLVGAGPVGIELAGEITAAWPDKRVTLLDLADDVLGDRFRPELRAELRRQLIDLGVELVLGEGLASLPPTPATEFGEFTVTTASGRSITADIWFQCFGVSPVSDFLDPELAPARGPDGFVRVGQTLQIDGHPNVFAIGDVSAVDAKMAGLAGRQAKVVADNIVTLVHGDGGDLATYAPFGPAIVVPIGPEGGSGQLPGQDELASREFVATVKGRDLMVDRYVEILGIRSPV